MFKSQLSEIEPRQKAYKNVDPGDVKSALELKKHKTMLQYGVKEAHRNVEDMVYDADSYILHTTEFLIRGKQFTSTTKAADFEGTNRSEIAKTQDDLLILLDREDKMYKNFIRIEDEAYRKASDMVLACKEAVDDAHLKKNVARVVTGISCLSFGLGVLTVRTRLSLALGVAFGGMVVCLAGLVIQDRYASTELELKTLTENVASLEKVVRAVREGLKAIHSQIETISYNVKDMKRSGAVISIHTTYKIFRDKFDVIKESGLKKVEGKVADSKQVLQNVADYLLKSS